MRAAGFRKHPPLRFNQKSNQKLIIMKVLITGASGRLGGELKKVFPGALTPTRSELDVTERSRVFSYIKRNRPDVVIHAAAMTDAKECESDQKKAWGTNVEGTGTLLKAFKKFNPDGYFVYISTAGVFKGDGGDYAEDDCPNPINFYCLTKLCGEIITGCFENTLILRTNFVPRGKWPHKKAFTDRFGTYLYTDDVAKAVKDVVERRLVGIVHVCGDEKLSMYDVAKFYDKGVEKTTLDEHGHVKLPKNMSLVTKIWHPYRISKPEGGVEEGVYGMRHRNDCRICGSEDLVKFLSLGPMPLAGGFIKENEIKKEKSYPLDVYFCRNCKAVQLLDVVSADVLFKDYRYLSSVTKTLSEHFRSYAKIMKDRFGLDGDSLVVEFGSNDGVLQKPFKDIGITSIGVEPAKNVAKIARSGGLIVINDYFTEKTAKTILERYGKADMICGNNAFAHIDDMHEVMRAIKILLRANGVFVFEVHYLVDLMEKYQYDMIYHEHLMYHSLIALSYLLNLFDMEIFDVERIPIHSGSIRVYAKNIGDDTREVHENVGGLVALERGMGLDSEGVFFKFSSDVVKKRDQIINIVNRLKSDGKRIIGYGASGRSSIHINFCGFSPKEVEYVIDMSPERQNRLIPGRHIRIVGPDILKRDNPDYALLFAYNYEKEVLDKEREFIRRGGRFIIPVPDIRIVPHRKRNF